MMTLNSTPCSELSNRAGKFSCKPGESKAEHIVIADPDEVSEDSKETQAGSNSDDIWEKEDWTNLSVPNQPRQEADLSPANTSSTFAGEDSDGSSGSSSTSEEKQAKHEKNVARAGVAESGVADLDFETFVFQALQQLATAMKKSEDAAKVAAGRHADDLALLRNQLQLFHREAFSGIKALQGDIQCLRAAATIQVDSPSTEGHEKEISVGENRRDVSSGSTSTSEEGDRSPSSTSSTSVGEDCSNASSGSTSTSEDRFWTPELVDAQLLIAELAEKNQALEERLSSLSEAAQKLLQVTLAEVDGMPTPMASQARELETRRMDWSGQRIQEERDDTMLPELRPTLLEFPLETILPAPKAPRMHLGSCFDDSDKPPAIPARTSEENPQDSDGRGWPRKELTHQLQTVDQAVVELQMENQAQPRFNLSAAMWLEMSLGQLEATRREEDSQEMCCRPRLLEGGFLPPDVWPTLLKFIPVAEVVSMQIRAVSSFFSSSKVWVNHLFQLMDLDCLSKHCAVDMKHHAIHWCSYDLAWNAGNVEKAEEIKNNCDNIEGFEGYRYWFNGLFVWHKLHPEITLQFVQTLVQLYPLGPQRQIDICDHLGAQAISNGVLGLRLSMADSVLAALRVSGLQPRNYACAIHRLECCQPVFGHLSNDFILEVFNIATSWEDQTLCDKAMFQLSHIMEATLMKDSDANFAVRVLNDVTLAKTRGNTEEVEAAKQKFDALLTKRRDND